ncbi:MAG TPA: SAM-dependent chlorinase/fluorinase [Sedimentisphaerales bacterium]|nr:SAM-dependent chlorinase/fluorinase [Sedimentisphaerales bacterium]
MVVLLTDFGHSEYVGVMKGVIYGIAREAKVVDLCHTIAPQNVTEGSWVLKNSYKYFPEGTVFCCVVDPGVGTQRKAIAVKTDKYRFVAPDNGLLWETVKEQRVIDMRQIPLPADASRTFHGRDVFARVAAAIELGDFERLGSKTGRVERLEFYKKGTEGIVVRIDGFGNVVTNLGRQDKDKYSVRTGRKRYAMEFYPDYSSAKERELFLIEGSSNTLEISLKNGNANARLRLQAGARIEIS